MRMMSVDKSFTCYEEPLSNRFALILLKHTNLPIRCGEVCVITNYNRPNTRIIRVINMSKDAVEEDNIGNATWRNILDVLRDSCKVYRYYTFHMPTIRGDSHAQREE
jgi:hypothetical protein